MPVVPRLFSDWWEELKYPHLIFDQNFGLCIHPNQLTDPNILEQYRFKLRIDNRAPVYYRSWNDLLCSKEQSGISTVKADKDKFQVMLDMQQFTSEEINVKVVEKFVVVEAKHEEKLDEHGWISRQFARKYMIPEQCDIDQVTSSLSSDGVLSIAVPRKDKPKTQIGRAIKIEHTGKPAIQEKAQEKTQEKAQEKAQEKPQKKPQEKAQEKPQEKAQEMAQENAQEKIQEKGQGFAQKKGQGDAQKAQEKAQEKKRAKVIYTCLDHCDM